MKQPKGSPRTQPKVQTSRERLPKCRKVNGGLPGKGTKMTPERREGRRDRLLLKHADKPFSILRKILGWNQKQNAQATLIWKNT
jgi:hypothetical protein